MRSVTCRLYVYPGSTVAVAIVKCMRPCQSLNVAANPTTNLNRKGVGIGDRREDIEIMPNAIV